MEWEVEPCPEAGEFIRLNGTVEKVYRELLKVNPNYEQELAAFVSKHESNNHLGKRTDFSTSRYFCNDRWKGASTGDVRNGIKYLRSLSGRPHLGPGPGRCRLVSCSQNSAIIWCNDVSAASHTGMRHPGYQ
jgi:hypothetical protein